jgi:hypothetical protein
MIGENCKYIYIYYPNYFLYSSNNNKQIITDNFIEYFTKRFNFEKIPPELDFDFKFYATLFSNYIQYLKTPDTKILSFWNKQLKPFIKNNYPIIKNGIFVMNADFDFLIKEIDKYNISKEKSLVDEIKKKINENNKKDNINSNKNTNTNTKTNTNTNVNKPIINNDNLNSKNDLRPHSETIASASTCDSYLYDSNSNILNNIKDKKEKNNNKIINEKKIENIENDKNKIIDNNKNSIIENTNFDIDERIGQKSKSEIIYKEMNQTFTDKDEIASKNIVYQPLQKTKIKLIDVNLLLKKIVENDFSKKNSEILYAFIRQSFSFMKKDIFIKKIINCYRHYKKLKISSSNLGNLIYFLNAYIIEMFLYYKSIPTDKKLLELFISFYNELIIDNTKMLNVEKKNVDKNAFLKKEFCLDMIKIGKNDSKRVIKEYSKNYISKKILKYINNNKNKNIQHIKKDDLEMDRTSRMTQMNMNDLIKDINLEGMDIDNDDGRKTHYFQNSLNINQTYIPKKKNNLKNKEISPKNEEISHNIIDDSNITEKTRNNSSKGSKKRIEKYEFENITDDDLINIIGKDYEDIIKNKLIINEEEKILLNIINIIILLYTKEYNESQIIKIKNNEIFYENFSFYEGKEKEKEKDKDKSNKKKKLEKKMLTRNQSQAIFSKSMTLNVSDLKLNISKLKPKKYFCVLDWETSQIGDKLINISIKLLNKIEYKELYGALFTKNYKESNCPNIMENIQKFNNLILFIIEDILSYDFPKDRARILEKWVLIAQYCKSKKDQSNCFAIKSALSHYTITGLKLTLNEIKSRNKAIMNEIDDYCNLEGNYKAFREEIKNIKKNEFFVPYLGLLLRDLTFFEESGKYLVQGNLINFEKIEKVQYAFDSFFKFKENSKLVNNDIDEELKFFDNLEGKTEAELEKIANKLEPEFKLAKIQQKEKRLTQIDKKYFLIESKRASCILNNTKTMRF